MNAKMFGAWIVAAAVTLAASAAWGQMGPAGGGGPRPGGEPGLRRDGPQPVKHEAKALSGTVQGFNYGPRGEPTSLMLKEGDRVVQLNFPLQAGKQLGEAVAAGDAIKAQAYPELGMPDHPIYQLQSLTTAKGQEISVGPVQKSLEGTIKSLNYGPRGEVDGAVLESGELVWFGRAGSELGDLAVGKKLTAEGMLHTTPTGVKVLTAQKLNGKDVAPQRGPDGGGRPGMQDGMRPEMMPDGPGPRDGMRDGMRDGRGKQGDRMPGGPGMDRPRQPAGGPGGREGPRPGGQDQGPGPRGDGPPRQGNAGPSPEEVGVFSPL